MKKLLLTLALCLATLAPAKAAGVLILAGAKPPAVYVGPGDIATYLNFYSCAFVYNAADASSSTNMCDVVATGTTTPVCTLRGTTSGAVDLSASYCPGATTPATFCSGGCSISQVYDQVAGVTPQTQATTADMPLLAFSTLGGQPCINFTGNPHYMSNASFVQAQPLTLELVAEKTGTTGGFISFNASVNGITVSTANQWGLFAGIGFNITSGVTDGTFHALQAVFNGSSGSYNLDGTTTASQNFGTNSATGTYSLGLRSGAQTVAKVCETGALAGDQSATYTTMNSNMHSRYGF